MQKVYRIGLFGGTFNPVHKGHAEVAESAVRNNLVDRVEVIPVYSAAHKDNLSLLPYKVRCKLVREIFFAKQSIYISEVESSLPSPSYTIRTIQYYKRRFPKAKIFLLLGSSDFIEIPKWYHGKNIMQTTNSIIIPRNKTVFEDVLNTIKKYHRVKYMIYDTIRKATIITTNNLIEYIYLHKRKIPISSSKIRNNKWGSSVRKYKI